MQSIIDFEHLTLVVPTNSDPVKVVYTNSNIDNKETNE